jgi:hypothetical protein
VSSPARSIEEQVAEQFYEWELRGRGWQLWDEPVRPVPPFKPFLGHGLVDVDHPSFREDDGRSHTLLSGVINWLHRKCTGQQRTGLVTPDDGDVPEEPKPAPWEDPGDVIELQVSLPPRLDVSPQVMAQFLMGLSACSHPPAFEMVGTPDSVIVQFGCASTDADHVRQQLVAHFPDVSVVPSTGTLSDWWIGYEESHTVVAEFGLSREFMLPLATPHSLADADPLVGVTGVLADVSYGEFALLQVMFEPVRHPWAESVIRSVTYADGSPLFTSVRDFVGQSKRKVFRPLYGAVLRIATRSDEEDRAWDLARRLAGALSPLNNPEGNELIALENDGYDPDEHRWDVLCRRSRRSGMLLSSDELLSLVHLPSSSVRNEKLQRQVKRTKAAPSLAASSRGVVLGENSHAGRLTTVRLTPEQRARHTYCIGGSGTGKSTLLLNLIAQDLRNGDGVAVLDPHGDLIDAALAQVPPERVEDVIVFDPGDEEHPISFNVLSAHSTLEKNLLASDLVAVFRRLSTSWGDQMNAVLGNAILAFLESTKGGTLVDLRRFLVEPAFRKQFLSSITDPEVIYYWSKEFPLLTGRPQGPVLTRLDTFLRPKPIRYMVAQRESRLDFADMLDSGKILLARLAHGAIGAENAHLLGTLLVSKLHQAALGRQRVREEERRFFWLYMDEFHHFATPSMATVLSGVRKYRLGLVLAHQELQQLDAVPEVASAVTSNAYTRVCFRLGERDARNLASGFTGFEPADFQNLGTGEAICRVERAELDFNLQTVRVPPVDEAQAAAIRDEIIHRSRQRYTVPRAEVEALLNRSRGEGTAPAGDLGDAPIVSAADAVIPGNAVAETPDATAEKKPRGRPRKSITAAMPPVLPTSATPARVPTPPPIPSATPHDSAPSLPRSDVPTPPPSALPLAAEPAPKVFRKPAGEGRGGSGHQSLQQLIKLWAEGMGFRATIEGPVLGTRAADVALEKGEVTIAVELCVTTDPVHELGNVRKCLDAGFRHVVAISPDAQRLDRLREVVGQQLDEVELERVRFCSMDDFFIFVQGLEITAAQSEQVVRGYRVKREIRPPKTLEEQAAVQRNIADVLARLIHRMKGGE